MKNQKKNAPPNIDTWKPLPWSDYTGHGIAVFLCALSIIFGITSVFFLIVKITKIDQAIFGGIISASVVVGLISYVSAKHMAGLIAFERSRVLVFWLELDKYPFRPLSCSGPIHEDEADGFIKSCPGFVAAVVPLKRKSRLGSPNYCSIYVRRDDKLEFVTRRDWTMRLVQANWITTDHSPNSHHADFAHVQLRGDDWQNNPGNWTACFIKEALEFLFSWYTRALDKYTSPFQVAKLLLERIDRLEGDLDKTNLKLDDANTALHETGLRLRNRSSFGRHKTAKDLADAVYATLQTTLNEGDPRLAAQEALATPRRKKAEEHAPAVQS